jgi:hypothetical protein
LLCCMAANIDMENRQYFHVRFSLRK